MGRPLRLDPTGGRHRVSATATRPAFDDPAARSAFESLVAELPGRYGLDVHGCALSPDGFTLALTSARGRLSDGIGWLIASLSRAIPGEGPLFRSRFRSALIDDDETWAAMLAELGAAAGAPSVSPASVQPITPGRALQEVQAVTGQTRDALSAHQRGVANPSVWLAIWWLSRRTTLSQREIGALLGIEQTGVAHRLRRAEAALRDNAVFQALAAALEERARRPTRARTSTSTAQRDTDDA